MQDPAYKRLFSRPHLIQDLLRGFVARGWGDGLDFSTLTPIPASFSSDRMREAWLAQVLAPRRKWGAEMGSMAILEEVRSMLAESVREWTADWVAEGREQGLKEGIERGVEQERRQGIEQERRLLCRQAARKFRAVTAPRLSALLESLTDQERLAQVGEWIIECETEEDLLDRVRHAAP